MKGLKLHGIKKLAGETKTLNGYDGRYIQVNYDMRKDEVWGDYLCSIGHNTWVEYHDPHILCCGKVCEPWTMKELRDMIEDEVAYAKGE